MTQLIVDSLPPHKWDERLFAPGERGSVSSYTNICGRFVNLQTAENAAKEAQEVSDYNTMESYFARGHILHKMCELYYGFPNITPVWRLPTEFNGAYEEAYKLFAALKAQLPQDFATRIETEVAFPRTLDEKTLIGDHFGVPVFRGIIDALVWLDEEKARDFDLRFFNGTETVVPGLWVVDWKTEGSTERDFKYVLSHQRMAYTEMVRLALGEEVQGMIFARIVNKKEPVVIMTAAPPCTSDELAMLRNDFGNAAARIKDNVANGVACVQRYRVCKFYENGQCRRY